MARYVDQADLSPHDAERDGSFATLPGLIVIDGGKGQLSAGMRALGPLAERGTTVIGLAKRIEEVFLPGRPDLVPIPRDSEALRLLRRARRGAQVRDRVPSRAARQGDAPLGVRRAARRRPGPQARPAESLRLPGPVPAREQEELEAVPGIPGKLARDIHKQLHRAG